MPERKQLHRIELLVPEGRVGNVHGQFFRRENETDDGFRIRQLGRRGYDEGDRTQNRNRSFHFLLRRIVHRHVRIRLRRVFQNPERLVPEFLRIEIGLDFLPFVRPFFRRLRPSRSLSERQIPLVDLGNGHDRKPNFAFVRRNGRLDFVRPIGNEPEIGQWRKRGPIIVR